jgi:Na+/H+ antiporter NhaD/arsenite permease-like protein
MPKCTPVAIDEFQRRPVVGHVVAYVIACAVSLAFFPLSASAAEIDAGQVSHNGGIFALVIFAFAYLLVIAEEFTHLRKSKPMVIAAGIIWTIVAFASSDERREAVVDALRHNLLEYGELLLFLIAAMTYVNTLEERNVFAALRSWLIAKGFSFRSLFWITGGLSFCLSPVLDNLTTALIMGTVVANTGKGNPKLVALACINIVIAANAGGAFSPFGDITTLMVWQKGLVDFTEFFALFLPSLVNWLVPAACMSFAIPAGQPGYSHEKVAVKYCGYVVAMLFGTTIFATVLMHQALHLPPFLGMMTGLGALQVLGYFIRRREVRNVESPVIPPVAGMKPAHRPFDVFISMKRVEWDTLMFFYGVILCVGGLGALGYLGALSEISYSALGPSTANILVGLASAIVDNIPVMFAVLSISPDMSHGQWLLVTLTAGVGGSLLSIGSAAGVALMGQARGIYTFFAHLKWIWAIALGYAASIGVHFLVNASLF